MLTTKPANPFNEKYITYAKNIDEKLIREAIKEFVGVYDFKYFQKQEVKKRVQKETYFPTKFL